MFSIIIVFQIKVTLHVINYKNKCFHIISNLIHHFPYYRKLIGKNHMSKHKEERGKIKYKG